MRCPWCGELVPDDALICHRCGNKLGEEGVGEDMAPPTTGTAVGEWRAVARSRAMAELPSRKRRVWRYGLTPLIYGLLVLAIASWIGLSLTVWGNPSPLDRSATLFKALARGDEEAFLACFREDQRERGREIFKEALVEYGAGTSFRELEFNVESDDGYEALVRLERATVEGGRFAGKELGRQDGIILLWENHRGSWYLDPARSRITPI